jgi:hypothetical protein
VDSYIALSYWDLATASVLVFINAGLSVIFRLRVHRSLLIAAIRMVVQLALVGVVLTTLFSLVSLGLASQHSEWFCLRGMKRHSGRSGDSLAGGPTGWALAA